MSRLNTLFRKRIGIPENENIAFQMLHDVLEKIAINIPFENLSIIRNNFDDITKENLINKILVKKEGGLCYELNSILYLFLLENGFKVIMARGDVYENATQEYLTLGRTHVTILITYEGQTYLIDTGFGGNLPLKPVPLTGETITSNNGEFRIKKVDSEYGDYVFEMKLKHKNTEWKIGYAFDSKKPITEVSEFNEVQTIIAEHHESPFNKNSFLTRLTNEGNLTLTKSSFTQWINGKVIKEAIDNKRYKELAKQYFGIYDN